MANINFPNNPEINDIFTINGKSYKWDGVKWVAKTTVDKSDVGLGNVQNFSIADQAEAEAGSVNNKYMTPLRTAQFVQEKVFSNNIIPTEDSSFDLGSTTNRFKDLYLSGNTLFIGDLALKDEGNNGLGIMRMERDINSPNHGQLVRSIVNNNSLNVNKQTIELNNLTNDAQVKRTEMGVADGVATLDANAKVPLNQLPDTTKQQAFVVANFVDLPSTNLLSGDKGFVTSTGNSYIWNGTQWLVLAKADWENVNLSWANITDKPTEFAPATHTHSAADVTSGTLTLAQGGTNRSDGRSTGVIETNSNNSLQFWQGSQAQYDAIVTKDANTLYFVTEV